MGTQRESRQREKDKKGIRKRPRSRGPPVRSRKARHDSDTEQDSHAEDSEEEQRNEEHDEMLRNQQVHRDIQEKTIGKFITLKTKAGYDFEVHRVPFIKHPQYNLTQEHLGIFLRKWRNARNQKVSMLSAMKSGLTKVLQMILEKLHENHEDNAFWVTLVLPQNAGEIRGHLWLFSDKLDAVARYYQKELERILTSNTSIMMDKTFGVYVHIMDDIKTQQELQLARMNLRKIGRPPKRFERGPSVWRPDEAAANVPHGGPKKEKDDVKESYLQELPDNPLFGEQCIITSTIISAANIFQYSDDQIKRQRYQTICQLNDSARYKRGQAEKEISKEIEAIEKDFPGLKNLPLEDRTFKTYIESLSKYYKANVFVHSRQNEFAEDRILWKFPLKTREDMPKLHILSEIDPDTGQGHCVSIRWPKKYSEVWGEACHYCGKTSRSRTRPSYHVCHCKEKCDSCARYMIPANELPTKVTELDKGQEGNDFDHRIVRLEFKRNQQSFSHPHETLILSRHEENPLKYYCNSNTKDFSNPSIGELEEDYHLSESLLLPEHCESSGFQCGFELKTKTCKDYHTNIICKNYWKCSGTCQRVVTLPNGTTHEEMSIQHDCNDDEIGFCRNCNCYHNFMDLEHLCPIKCYNLIKNHPTFGFLAVSMEEIQSSHCTECYAKDKPCKNHRESSISSEPNYILYASEKHGNQGTFEFMHKHKLPQSESNFPTDPYSITYLPKHEMSEERKKGNYGRNLRWLRPNWEQEVDKAFPKNERNILIEFMVNALKMDDSPYNNRIIVTDETVISCLTKFHRVVTIPAFYKRMASPSYLEFDSGLKLIDFEKFVGIPIPAESKSFFPHVNNRFCFDLNEPPKKESYFSNGDSREERKAKIDFFKRIEDLEHWNFKTALQKHLYDTVKNMINHTMKVQNVSVSIQDKLKEVIDKTSEFATASPFSYGSFTHFAYVLLQNYSLKNNDIKIVRNGPTVGTMSRPQHKWELWLRKLIDRSNLISAFNHPLGARRFRNRIVDAFDKSSKIVHEFMGTYYHSCELYKNCSIIKKNGERFVDDKTHKQLMKERKTRKKQLLDINKTKKSAIQVKKIKDVKPHEECQTLEKMQDDATFEYNPWPQNLLPHRLEVNDAIYGGQLNVYKYLWSKNENSTQNFYFVDLNSSYGSVARSFNFPKGRYKLTLDQDIKNFIKFDENQGKFVFQSTNQEVYGLALVDMIVPEDEADPFLIYRTKDGRVLNPSCGSCAEEARTEPCNHHDKDQRILHGTWTFQELAQAISKHNYKCDRLHEVLTYEDSGPIMKEFYDVLAHFSLKYKKPMSDAKTYCQDINKKMEFPKALELNEEDIPEKEDKFMKKLFKFIINSSLGRLMKKNSTEDSYLVKNRFDVINNMENITGFSFDKSDVIMHLNKNFGQNIQDPYNNAILGAYVTSYGRIQLDNLKQEIRSIGGEIVYTDCDCVMFINDRNLPESRFGQAFGQVKNEISDAQEILSYASLGPKRYTIRYRTFENEFREISKFSGIKAPSEDSTTLSFEALEKLLASEDEEVATYQYMKTKDKNPVDVGALKVKRVVKVIKFNPMKTKRIYQKESHSSKAYGHKH